MIYISYDRWSRFDLGKILKLLKVRSSPCSRSICRGRIGKIKVQKMILLYEREATFTDPEEAKRFVDETKCRFSHSRNCP